MNNKWSVELRQSSWSKLSVLCALILSRFFTIPLERNDFVASLHGICNVCIVYGKWLPVSWKFPFFEEINLNGAVAEENVAILSGEPGLLLKRS